MRKQERLTKLSMHAEWRDSQLSVLKVCNAVKVFLSVTSKTTRCTSKFSLWTTCKFSRTAQRCKTCFCEGFRSRLYKESTVSFVRVQVASRQTVSGIRRLDSLWRGCSFEGKTKCSHSRIQLFVSVVQHGEFTSHRY